MSGSHRMGSDDDFQIRQVLLVGAQFCFWARWPRVFTVETRCYILIAIIALSNSQRSQDEADSQMMLLHSQVPHISQGIACVDYNKHLHYAQGGTSPPWVSPYVHAV